ncbi:MAG: sterol desaturase family protein [Novosphingobium sp.]
MDRIFDYGGHLVVTLVPVAVVFVALAMAVKRQAVWAAWQRCRHEFATNLGLVLLNAVVLAPVLLLPANTFHAQLKAIPGLAAMWNHIAWPLTLLAALLINELAVYWRHRAEHSGFLWRFHATHHADEAIHWLSVMRKHPVSRAFGLLFDATLLLLLGLPVWAIGASSLIRSWWGYFVHADVPWTLGPVGAVMISPAAHRLHHARDIALSGSNFGGLFTIWDRLFGTYVAPDAYINCETGIDEGTRSFLGELWRPFEDTRIFARYRRRAV